MLIDKKEPVIFAGENHMITLLAPSSESGSGGIAVSASCWRCTYSAHGEGWVLVIRNEAALSGLDLPVVNVFSDNAALARLVVEKFNQYFEGFRDLGFTAAVPIPAQFAQHGHGRAHHRITCTANTLTISLEWRDMLDGALEVFYNTSGPLPYDVSAVICHCAVGQIDLSGKVAQGAVKRIPNETYSSAFLAFSETWAEAKTHSA